MRRTAASLFLIAGFAPFHLAGVASAQESLEVSPDNSAALIDQSTLPTAIELKGSRPQADPSLLPPAATTLPDTLDSLNAPPSLALPNQPGQVRIRELRPLTLAEVEQLAEVNNPGLKAVALQVQQAKSSLRAAISSWYPTLNLTANGLPQYLAGEQQSFASGQSGTLTKSKISTANFAAQLNWNLIDPGRVPEIASARDTFEKSRDSYLIALRDLRLSVATAYYDLQRYDEQVNVGKQSVAASLISLRDARARYQAGVATKLEVLEAETQLARDQDILTGNLNFQARSRRDLARITDLPQDVTPTAASPSRVVGIWQPSLQESIVAAYAFREELDQIILDISINNSNANAALSGVQPVLSIFNNFNSQRFQGQSRAVPPVNTDAYGWTADNTVGLAATWNIFDGGRARAQYRRNKQAADASAYEFADKRGKIRLQVEQSFYDLRDNQQAIRTTSREVLSQREALRLARLRFQAGVATQREVVDNQRDLTRAQLRYVEALSDYNITISELRRYTGLDEVASCPRLDLPAEKSQSLSIEEFPIEPTPLIPACQASLLGS
ncbi:TolC family protein [Synechococcus sp. MIT S9508]|uniref:TolC family protein n=1 Tax=Synechococcus sp. MIT S9508 TaxID=1801629 RepID=UPI0007BBED3F|nr:outer membrane channel protein [Synechococcus sp. MIT S9508]